MNKREKMLLIALGVGLGLLVCRAVVRAYRGALQEYDSRISRLTNDLTQIEQERRLADEAARQWREEIGPQTLSMDEKEAANRLREEVFMLADRVGLADVTVDLASARPWERKGLKTLNSTVTGTGRLDVLVDFLLLLYRQPYGVRCRRMTLEQAVLRIQSDRRQTGGQGLLKMRLELDTLILPASAMVPQFETADLAADPRKEVARTVGASLADYDMLVERSLFSPYQPPPPPPPSPPRVAERPSRTQPAPPPPPPPDARMVLGRTLSSPRGQMAVLEEPGGRGGGEGTYKRVGDPMYGGTLVFVHPRGAVTEKEGKLLFHPLGEALSGGRELSAKEEPIVYHELLKLQERAGGISQRPG